MVLSICCALLAIDKACACVSSFSDSVSSSSSPEKSALLSTLHEEKSVPARLLQKEVHGFVALRRSEFAVGIEITMQTIESS